MPELNLMLTISIYTDLPCTLLVFKQLQNATDRLDAQDVNLRLLLGEINSTLSLKV